MKDPRRAMGGLLVLSILALMLVVGMGGAQGRVPPVQAQTTGPSDVPTVPTDETDGVTDEDLFGAGGGQRLNLVQIMNKVDARLRVRANVQLNRIRGSTVQPANVALAGASCIDCQTFAVALQVNVVGPDVTAFAPQNAAVAVNSECTRCYTVARAMQYVVQVDNIDDLPPRLNQLFNAMDRELRSVQSDAPDLASAEARINGVIAEFADLAESLYDQRDERADDGPLAAGTPTAQPTATVTSPEPTATASAAEPTATAPATEATATATPTPVAATSTPETTPVPTATDQPQVTPTPEATPTPQAASPTDTPTQPTPTAMPTSAATQAPTATVVALPTVGGVTPTPSVVG
jgi:hypothetical protein